MKQEWACCVWRVFAAWSNPSWAMLPLSYGPSTQSLPQFLTPYLHSLLISAEQSFACSEIGRLTVTEWSLRSGFDHLNPYAMAVPAGQPRTCCSCQTQISRLSSFGKPFGVRRPPRTCTTTRAAGERGEHYAGVNHPLQDVATT